MEASLLVLAISNAFSSHRGSVNISFTKSRVASRFLAKLFPDILILSKPALIEIEDPRRSIASSSSAGVLLLVPSSIRLATKLAVPFLSVGSNNCPPSIRK